LLDDNAVRRWLLGAPPFLFINSQDQILEIAMSHALTKRLFAPTDIASLVFFRILFGAVMLWEVWTSFSSGRIRRDFIDPSFHFTYSGFSWIKTLAG